jgi:hypothetical protein
MIRHTWVGHGLFPPHPSFGHLLPRGEGGEAELHEVSLRLGLVQRFGCPSRWHGNGFVNRMVDYRWTRIRNPKFEFPKSEGRPAALLSMGWQRRK